MINIAIDGPAGAGKSTIAKEVAKRLQFIYVDTGALYRAVGLYAVRSGVETTDKEKVTNLLPNIDISLKFVNSEQRVFLNGEDVSTDIRLPEISMAASNVSAIPTVREFLFDLQRKLARENNVIMDGRDIGTVVLPSAQVKIFLTASPEERARRRKEQLELAGNVVDYDKLLEEIKQRDYNDSHREIAPLKPAEDSVTIDTTGNELEQSIELLYNHIKTRI
ncbi:MAG: (d)CMP kinase [Oscillospiraceae bacterium]|nr:(d)CMP kinase [Oscillospiraceae bacterium]